MLLIADDWKQETEGAGRYGSHMEFYSFYSMVHNFLNMDAI